MPAVSLSCLHDQVHIGTDVPLNFMNGEAVKMEGASEGREKRHAVVAYKPMQKRRMVVETTGCKGNVCRRSLTPSVLKNGGRDSFSPEVPNRWTVAQ